MFATPPRLAEALLRSLLPPGDRDAVSGDLLEEFRENIYPSRGRRRAHAWYWLQVFTFLWRDHQLPAALLGSSLIVRNAFDWFVPTMDFHTRSQVTTFLAVGIVLFAGFSAAWRSSSPWVGAPAGVMSSFVGHLISTAGSICILAFFHDARTLAVIDMSGGLSEVFAPPVFLFGPSIVLGLVGGVFGYACRQTLKTT
jgi:hypothetical protein